MQWESFAIAKWCRSVLLAQAYPTMFYKISSDQARHELICSFCHWQVYEDFCTMIHRRDNNVSQEKWACVCWGKTSQYSIKVFFSHSSCSLLLSSSNLLVWYCSHHNSSIVTTTSYSCLYKLVAIVYTFWFLSVVYCHWQNNWALPPSHILPTWPLLQVGLCFNHYTVDEFH